MKDHHENTNGSATGKKRKEKRERSLYNSNVQEEKKGAGKSVDYRKITSAKSTSKRVVISTKNLLEEKKPPTPQTIYFEENEAMFKNTGLKDAFTKKKLKRKGSQKGQE